MTCRHLGEAYALCRSAGVHCAELVQIVSHDEACAGDSSVATRPCYASDILGRSILEKTCPGNDHFSVNPLCQCRHIRGSNNDRH